MPPEFLVVGHVVKDISPGGWHLGGAAAYAAMQAQRLGLRAAAVTSCGPEISPPELLPRVQWHVVSSPSTTTFENRYVGGRREQSVLDFATPIASGHVPNSWLETPIVLLGPVIGDVDPAVGSYFPEASLVGMGAQGWLRRLEGGKVQPGSVDPNALWLVGDILFVSAEDVDDPEAVVAWREHVPIVVLTRGPNGCTLWDETGRHDLPAFQSREIDPTGAGDVFAAAFLVRYHETRSSLEAARYGAAAASLLVQGVGIESVPTRDQIEAVLNGHGVRA
jgi:hypothetical protein